jgi:hypothetical protein
MTDNPAERRVRDVSQFNALVRLAIKLTFRGDPE